MQAKVFFASLLATILAVGVIATPTPVDDVDSQVTPPADNNVIENNAQGFATLAAPEPRPTGPIITPGDNDVPTASGTDVVARDLVSKKPCSTNLARWTVADFHNRRAWKSEPMGVFS